MLMNTENDFPVDDSSNDSQLEEKTDDKSIIKKYNNHIPIISVNNTNLSNYHDNVSNTAPNMYNNDYLLGKTLIIKNFGENFNLTNKVIKKLSFEEFDSLLNNSDDTYNNSMFNYRVNIDSGNNFKNTKELNEMKYFNSFNNCIDELNKKSASLYVKKKTSNQVNKAILLELEEAKNQVEVKDVEINEFKKNFESLEAELNYYINKNIELKSSLTKMRTKIAEGDQIILNLRQINRLNEERITDLNNEIIIFKNQLENLKKEYNNYKEDSLKKIEKITDLQDKIFLLQQENLVKIY